VVAPWGASPSNWADPNSRFSNLQQVRRAISRQLRPSPEEESGSWKSQTSTATVEQIVVARTEIVLSFIAPRLLSNAPDLWLWMNMIVKNGSQLLSGYLVEWMTRVVKKGERRSIFILGFCFYVSGPRVRMVYDRSSKSVHSLASKFCFAKNLILWRTAMRCWWLDTQTPSWWIDPHGCSLHTGA
jgi:hypothetical protein